MGLRDGHDCSAAQCRRLTLLASAEAKAAHDACWAARPGLRVCGYAEASGRTLKDVATRPRRFQRSERRPAPGPAGRSGPTRDITPLPDLVHGRSRAGPVRERAPGVCRPAAPVQCGLPGGREHPGLARACAGRRARAGLAGARRGQSVRGDPRPGLLPPVREQLQPRQARQRGLDPRRRALPRRSGAGARLAVRPRRGAQRQAGAGDRRRPERAVGCLPPGAARPRGRDPRRRRRAGRDDALRHPGLPDARATC